MALPNADSPVVGDDLDDGVDVVLRLEFLGPAAFTVAGEAGQAQVSDLHRVSEN